jgi:hypothetical protein
MLQYVKVKTKSGQEEIYPYAWLREKDDEIYIYKNEQPGTDKTTLLGSFRKDECDEVIMDDVVVFPK